MVDARVTLSDYSNRVLAVVKAKYALKDKREALNKFVESYGRNELECEATEAYVKHFLDVENEHFRKYGYKKMSGKELDALFGK